MRIISGDFKGRKFFPPADNWPTRPTTDFAKEGLFNILHNRLDWSAIRMLDLFGGTGNHGYEAISRGCNSVTYVDKHIPAVKFVRKTAETLNVTNKIDIVVSDVQKYLAVSKISFDYIFAGPPYGLSWLDAIPDMIFSNSLLTADGLFVLEHNPDHNFSQHRYFSFDRNYGTTIFSFFEW
jgi:16S rRNA (guanine966-N2)-methyltransferase